MTLQKRDISVLDPYASHLPHIFKRTISKLQQSVALGKSHCPLICYVGVSIYTNEGNRLAVNNLKYVSCQNFSDHRIPDSCSQAHSWHPSSDFLSPPCKPEQVGGKSPLLMSDTETGKCPQVATKETKLSSRQHFGPDTNSDINILPSSHFYKNLSCLENSVSQGEDNVCVTQARAGDTEIKPFSCSL